MNTMRTRIVLTGLLVPPAILLIIVGVAFARAWNGARLVAQAQGAPAQLRANLGETQSLRILPIVEAAAAGDFATARGVSYLVQTDDTTVLLDFGNPDETGTSPLARNMAALGESLADVNAYVISHSHPDHVGGYPAWIRGTFGTLDRQPDLGSTPIWTPVAMHYPGAAPAVSDAPVLLGAGIATSGLIGYHELFPITLVGGMRPEQALVVKVAGHGTVLITGCGHPGMEAMVRRAEAITGAPVIGVVGGLHYGAANAADLQSPIAFLAERNPELVALSPHDSGVDAIEALRAAFPTAYQPVAVGRAIVFPQEVAPAAESDADPRGS